MAAWTDQAWMDDPAGQNSALLHGLYIDRSWQRHGIGKFLQQAVAGAVQAAGGNGLHVRAERFAAHYFKRLGYRRLGRTELVDSTGTYEYRYWISCSDILRSVPGWNRSLSLRRRACHFPVSGTDSFNRHGTAHD